MTFRLNDKAEIFLKSQPVQVLLEIQNQGKPIRTTVAEETGVQPHNMNLILGRLEKNGLLTREVDMDRVGQPKNLLLTENGELLARKLGDMVELFNEVESSSE